MSFLRTASVVLVITATLGLALEAPASTIAYKVTAGTGGNQAHPGALGMDFNVNQSLHVLELGVFDSGSNGLSLPLQVRLYDRTNTAVPLATLDFTSADPGTLVGGSRFKPLAVPLFLPQGFLGTIAADGYGATELNGNIATPVSWTTDSGGGVLSFVGTSRYSMSAGVFPETPDGGPANRYAAGTFSFVVPEPSTFALLVAISGLGLIAYWWRRRK